MSSRANSWLDKSCHRSLNCAIPAAPIAECIVERSTRKLRSVRQLTPAAAVTLQQPPPTAGCAAAVYRRAGGASNLDGRLPSADRSSGAHINAIALRHVGRVESAGARVEKPARERRGLVLYHLASSLRRRIAPVRIRLRFDPRRLLLLQSARTNTFSPAFEGLTDIEYGPSSSSRRKPDADYLQVVASTINGCRLRLVVTVARHSLGGD